VLDRPRLRLCGRGGRLLRLLPRPEGGQPRPDRRPALRVRWTMKRRTALAAAAALLALGAGPVAAEEKPVRVAYYYKVRWGFQQEFERLFLKNHYPLLLAQKKEGTRIKAVNLYRPTFHREGRADWTFLV